MAAGMAEATRRRPWWERGTIYQIYPRSFQDSDSDGIGDLEGIRQRLGYVAGLGVDAVWISPIYPSPMADFGYDVSNYCDVDPMFGTLGQFDLMLAEAHRLGLKVMLDFVPNHTSTAHPWFVDSRSGRGSAKRDWYVWRNPAPDGGPPNNWTSDMGGPAWEFDPESGQYYLHAFLKEQADLNWRNPEVRAAMLDVVRFWFDRGVDGFRIDVLWHCFKAEGLPDNPPNPDYREGMGEKLMVLQQHSTDQPEALELAAELRRIADDYGDRLLVGEVFLPCERLCAYYGTAEAPGVHLPYNFQLYDTPWRAEAIAEVIERYEAALPAHGWPNWVLGSHDWPRLAGRIGEAQARVAAMLLLTLRGTPTLYQGDELGIGKVKIPPERIRDPQDLRQPGLGLGRDGARTPMPWNYGPNAGFSTAEPWLPLNSDWRICNVAAQDERPGSMLSHYRRLLSLRRKHDALSIGDFALLSAANGLLLYRRSVADGETLLIALNLSRREQRIELAGDLELLLSTHGGRCFDGDLLPDEGQILRVKAD